MNQEYYHSSVGYCTIWGDVVDKPDMVIVSENSDYGTLTAVSRYDLMKKEDTWEFQQAEKRRDEILLITAKAQESFDALADKIVDKALKSLETRMRLNMAFGKGGGLNAYAMMIVAELTKLIKDTGEKMKKDKDFNL